MKWNHIYFHLLLHFLNQFCNLLEPFPYLWAFSKVKKRKDTDSLCKLFSLLRTSKSCNSKYNSSIFTHNLLSHILRDLWSVFAPKTKSEHYFFFIFCYIIAYVEKNEMPLKAFPLGSRAFLWISFTITFFAPFLFFFVCLFVCFGCVISDLLIQVLWWTI